MRCPLQYRIASRDNIYSFFSHIRNSYSVSRKEFLICEILFLDTRNSEEFFPDIQKEFQTSKITILYVRKR